MTRNDIIERILERIEKHRQENYSNNSCVFFFTSQWPYKELNKMFTDCGIQYSWNDDKSSHSIERYDLSSFQLYCIPQSVNILLSSL